MHIKDETPSFGQHSQYSAPFYGTRVYYSEQTDAKKNNSSQPQSTEQKKPERFTVGDRVRHTVFGEGEVYSVRAVGNDVLYEIVFDTVGTKKIMGNYVKMKKL